MRLLAEVGSQRKMLVHQEKVFPWVKPAFWGVVISVSQAYCCFGTKRQDYWPGKGSNHPGATDLSGPERLRLLLNFWACWQNIIQPFSQLESHCTKKFRYYGQYYMQPYILTLSSLSLLMVIFASMRWLLRTMISRLSALFSSSWWWDCSVSGEETMLN